MPEYIEISSSSRKREDEIKRIIERASPFVVWPADEGVVIVAANRDARENRIHAVYDRIACVTLGSFSGGTNLWQHAAIVASSEGHNLSKGDVSCRIITKNIATLLSASFHDIRKGPLYATEAVFMEIDEERDCDYLVHLNFMGFVDTFDKARLFGRLDPEGDSGAELNDRAEKCLDELWDPTQSLDSVVPLLRQEESFSRLFRSKRVETVSLSRTAVREGKYSQVFHRQT